MAAAKFVHMSGSCGYMVTAVTVTVSSKKIRFLFCIVLAFSYLCPRQTYYYEERTEDLSAFADARAGIVQVALRGGFRSAEPDSGG